MTPAPPLEHSPRSSHLDLVVAAYISAMHISPEDVTEALTRVVVQALIAHAADDESAAEQAGLSSEEISHQRLTLNAYDGLPLIIVATTPQASGRFYFSRPVGGWPRPGHRILDHHRHSSRRAL